MDNINTLQFFDDIEIEKTRKYIRNNIKKYDNFKIGNKEFGKINNNNKNEGNIYPNNYKKCKECNKNNNITKSLKFSDIFKLLRCNDLIYLILIFSEIFDRKYRTENIHIIQSLNKECYNSFRFTNIKSKIRSFFVDNYDDDDYLFFRP